MAKREGYEVTDEWLEQINEELRKKMCLTRVDLGMLGGNGLSMLASQLLIGDEDVKKI